MNGDCRSAVLCITSLSRLNDRYVSDDSFTGGALGDSGDGNTNGNIGTCRRSTVDIKEGFQ